MMKIISRHSVGVGSAVSLAQVAGGRTVHIWQGEEANMMGEWSPSHLIVAAIAVATIIGQLIIVLTRLKTITERLEKRMDKQDETIRQQGLSFVHALERLEERMDKRFVEVNQRFDEVNQRFGETNQRIDGL